MGLPLRSLWLLSRRYFTLIASAEHGHKELTGLIREFDQLLRHVPVTSRLVGDVYRAAFCTRIPASEEVTSLTGSRILNLTSTRAQDFEHARYLLVESLPLYFKASPESATETLVDLAECFFGQGLDPDEPVETLVVSGVSARYVADRTYGRTWDSYDRDGPPLQQFESELVALVDNGRIQDVRQGLGCCHTGQTDWPLSGRLSCGQVLVVRTRSGRNCWIS